MHMYAAYQVPRIVPCVQTAQLSLTRERSPCQSFFFISRSSVKRPEPRSGRKSSPQLAAASRASRS